MAKKIHKTQLFRFLSQVLFLILLPGLFTLAFGEIKRVYIALISGGFDIISILPNLIESIVIIGLTVVLGRVFCGWICAFGTFNEIISMLSRKVFNINVKINPKVDSILKYLKYIILGLSIIFIWTLGATAFKTSSPWDAFAQITNLPVAISRFTIGFIILVVIGIGSIFVERFFCRYLCPLGAILSGLSLIRILKISKPREDCGKCRVCTSNCSMGIELNEVDKVKTGECINCLNCVEVCPRNNAVVTVFDQKLNPALAGAIAISGFVGLYGFNAFASNNANQEANINVDNTISTESPTNTGSANMTDNNNSPTTTNSISSSQNSNDLVSNNTNSTSPSSSQNNSSKATSSSSSGNSTTTTGSTNPANNNSITNTQTTNSTPVRTVSPNTNNTPVPVVTKAPTPVPTAKRKYNDGTYTGVATGFEPGLNVSVTIVNDRITSVQVLANNETPEYLRMVKTKIPAAIVSAQSTNVNVVSGATYSSNGIMAAVRNALSKATA